MENNELQHWGVKGMRWGRRRYQNKDGSLTPAGKKRYDEAHDDDEKSTMPADKKAAKTAVSKGKNRVKTALGIIGGITVASVAAKRIERGIRLARFKKELDAPLNISFLDFLDA